ncbi:MAG: WecB/TagA/CpsF family glycosyltransferase [Candidatus Altimarinota bacterium]
MKKSQPSNIKILDIPFTTLNKSEILEFLEKNFQKKNPDQLFLATPNPEMLLAAEKNPKFKSTLQNTSLNLPDGNGIIWANYYFQKTTKNNNKLWLIVYGAFSLIPFAFLPKTPKAFFQQAIHGSDLTLEIAKGSLGKHGLFLLGNQKGLHPKTAELTANILQKKYPHLKISGYADSHPDDPTLIQKINHSGAKILLIGFGAPHQENWIAENLSKLPNIKLAMGVGGTFDFISGILPRAPKWMRQIGLEWLYRLYKQPKRIKRIYNALVVFTIKVIQNRLAN